MSTSMDALALATPPTDLERLSFCSATPGNLSTWLETLPLANTAETTSLLKQATEEVARLQTPWRNRIALLEALRESVGYMTNRLDRTAGASMQNMSAADDAQRLEVNLCVGYKAAIRDALADSRPGDELVLAIHRCISDMSRCLLRACQLYSATPPAFWLELHTLYRLASEREIEHKTAQDNENHHRMTTSIEAAYIRALLLATTKPNQLRSTELAQIFNAIELWTEHAPLSPFDGTANFAIDQNQDQPPRYVTLSEDSPSLLGMGTEVLTFELVAFLGHVDGKLQVPDYLDNQLLEHLSAAWSSMPERTFRRMPSDAPLKVAIGLRAVHYFISGGIDFAEQLGTTDALLKREINPFLNEKTGRASSDDVWDAARIPENPNIDDPDKILLERSRAAANDGGESGERYAIHDALSSDMSPEGYRISWRDMPANASTGELITVRDESDERWCIAVIRWLQRSDSQHTMGVELLAPRAIPVAARVIRKKGGPSDFMRALVLPEISAIGRPATLLTPALVFATGQKIQVQRQGIRTIAQLLDVQLTTQSFTQFTFRLLDGYLENAPTDLSMA